MSNNEKTIKDPRPACLFLPKGEPVPLIKGSHVYLIDGSGYIYRAFHALPPLTRPSDGLPIGAVHGFCAMLWKLMGEAKLKDRPTHIVVLFDHSAKTFRNDIYPEYKAHRPPPPEELVPQFPLIREAVKAFNVACIEQVGYEADDLIATYTSQAVKAGADVTVVSSDKDLMQLVGPGVVMLDGMKNKLIGPEEVFAKFGVPPDKVIDVQSLAGDSTDNIPGVPGIGIKTAAMLIKEYGDLDTLLAQAQEIKQNKRREKLIEFADQARISRDLVTLSQDVPVVADLEKVGLQEPIPDALLGFLQDMEFNTLTQRIAKGLGTTPPPPAKTVSAPKRKSNNSAGSSTGATNEKQHIGPGHPQAAVTKGLELATATPIDPSVYTSVTTTDELNHWIQEAREKGRFAIDTETTGLDAASADLVGISLATAPGRACYIPLAHRTASEGFDFDEAQQIHQIPIKQALDALRPLLQDPSVLKIGQNIKYDALILKRYEIELTPIDDTMLLSYALDAGRGGNGMDELAQRHLGHTCIPFKAVIEHAPGSKKADKTFAQVPVPKATEYAAEDADVTFRLWLALKPRLAAEHRATVYETLERPLVPVIAEMEHEGIKVDRKILARLSAQFAEKIAELGNEIQKLAGYEFNLASPKQLGELLFDKLKLPGGKKTKTGQWETRATLLDDLSNNEELPEDAKTLINKMLEWRQLSKLRSTYTDALPNFINERTGRIHTSYILAATTTGRLASSDPNLQNIPIRTSEGREIRTAFVAEKGCKLISADYSQIELRVLAHIADIPQLKKAFEDGLDIHALTASEMFDVPIAEMTPEVRRRAKAINFGIIYGISAFGLANQLGISRSEASDYIKTYFKRFPGIRDYMEETKSFAHEHEYVETLFKRRIHYPQINTKHAQTRSFMERAAINAPIQGTAADIIRRAMIAMPRALSDANLASVKMLLQVHDELVFEVEQDMVEKAMPTICKTMENACLPATVLAVPLKVDAKAADNWEEAH